MKLVNLDRGEGKTTKAVKQAHETGAYIIVQSRNEAHNCMEIAKSLDLNIRFPITFNEFLQDSMRGSHIRNIIIEDAERLFLSLFRGLKIEMITMNIDLKTENKILREALEYISKDKNCSEGCKCEQHTAITALKKLGGLK